MFLVEVVPVDHVLLEIPGWYNSRDSSWERLPGCASPRWAQINFSVKRKCYKMAKDDWIVIYKYLKS